MSQGFRHEALLYSGEDEFVSGTLPFIRDGLANDEPVMVAVEEDKIGLLERRLKGDAHRISFLDMASLGRNPARIIPLWREFVAEHGTAGGPIRGIGEPVWRGRSEAELSECDRHEALLNLAFADVNDFALLCPFDSGALSADVLAAAHRTHPRITEHGLRRESAAYMEPALAPSPFAGVLAPPADEPDEFAFDGGHLSAVRRFVRRHARTAGLTARRQSDLVTAINELAANTVRHAGAAGTVRVWREPGGLLCEVEDHGRLDDRLAGRRRPAPEEPTGRGLWIVNQLCDLVQIRSGPNGTVVRVRIERAPQTPPVPA